MNIMHLASFYQKIRPYVFRSNIFIPLCLFIIIWFISPHLHIGGDIPFRSIGARVCILTLFASIYILKITGQFIHRYRRESIKQLTSSAAIALKFIKTIIPKTSAYLQLKYHLIKHRLTSNKTNMPPNKLAWYLILGSEQSGKKTLLANSGLYFSKAEHFGDKATSYLTQTPEIDWWFSEACLFINPMNADKEASRQNWKKLVKILKRDRKTRPINGILLPVSLLDLMTYSNQQRQTMAHDIGYYIRDIYQQFKAKVPVYLIFTKCDLIEGFIDFFNDLSKTELNQIWGISFPFAESHSAFAIKNHFNNEYRQIIEHLRSRVLFALDSERTLEGRERIFAFPQQMQLLKQPIETFISELFTATRIPHAMQLRGAYFISSIQAGKPIDLLMQAMSKKFQLIAPSNERPERMGECYFLRHLFSKVILPEAKLMGLSERRSIIKTITFKTLQLSLPIVALCSSYAMLKGYEDNKSNLRTVENYIHQYEQLRLRIHDDSVDIKQLVPMLETLKNSANLYTNRTSFASHFLYATYSIRAALQTTYQRSLHAEFLPRIAAKLEQQLSENIVDQNILYATLKGYMAFHSQRKQNQEILPPIELIWEQAIKNHALLEKYQSYIKTALNTSIDQLPLDTQLINNRRNQLAYIVPSERVYGLLKLHAQVSDLHNLNLAAATGWYFHDIFQSKQAALPIILGFYTNQGYDKVYRPHINSISKEVTEDNRIIGLSSNKDNQSVTQIESEVDSRYSDDYTHAWHQQLANIDIKPFTSINDAIAKLNIILNIHSPLSKLLDVLYDNTHQINTKNILVHSYFSDINAYHENQGHPTEQQSIQSLTALRDYLQQLQQDPNQNQAFFHAAIAIMSNKTNPIEQLKYQAQFIPEPAKKWLSQIADNSWAIISDGALQKIDADWQRNIIPYYRNNLEGHYPMLKSSRSPLSIEDFNNFFATNGMLDQFFQTEIKPFINIDQATWALLKINGHYLPLLQADLATFKRVQLIRNDYFANKDQVARLNCDIKPALLDANASHINLIIGNHTIQYAHGPEESHHIRWPMENTAQVAKIFIKDFKDNHYNLGYSGPWSFFQLLQHGELKPIGSAGRYLYSVNIQGLHASFIINATSNINTLLLTDLVGLTLPSHLRHEVHV